MKWFDFITKRLLPQKNEAKACINSVDEAIARYYQVFANRIKSLSPESQLSDIYYTSEIQKNGELLINTVDTGMATYALDKYLKK